MSPGPPGAYSKGMNFRHLVIVADDDEEDFEMARNAFHEADPDCEVRWAEHGGRLLDMLRASEDDTRPASLVIMDLNMPFKSGREALREIKSDPFLRRIPVIVMTLSRYSADVRHCYEDGANCVLIKPFEYFELVRTFK